MLVLDIQNMIPPRNQAPEPTSLEPLFNANQISALKDIFWNATIKLPPDSLSCTMKELMIVSFSLSLSFWSDYIFLFSQIV